MGILLTIIAGSVALIILFSITDGGEERSIQYEFESTIDHRNNTVKMTEPNRTVNWNDYLVVVNETFVMKRSQISVPGITTVFHHRDWDPQMGCCYDVEVVDRGAQRRIWNGTIEAK